ERARSDDRVAALFEELQKLCPDFGRFHEIPRQLLEASDFRPIYRLAQRLFHIELSLARMLGRILKDLFASKVRLPGQIDFAAVAHRELGTNEAARECCETALALDPGLHPAHGFLASLNFPGPFYLEIISMFHSHLRPRTYLEIGVESGQSIALARRETRAIGIDPEPRITEPLAPGTSIHAITSDEYFAAHDVRAEF